MIEFATTRGMPKIDARLALDDFARACATRQSEGLAVEGWMWELRTGRWERTTEYRQAARTRAEVCGRGRRDLPTNDAALDEPTHLWGYAALYGVESLDLGGFKEVVEPGAFTETLAESADVMARYNHQQLMARTSAGTLDLYENPLGLQYVINLPDTTAGRDLSEMVRRGDLNGSSFAFSIRDVQGERWERRADGSMLRHLCAVDLKDVAPCDYPAYPATGGMVCLRSRRSTAPHTLPCDQARLRLAAAEAGPGWRARPNSNSARLRLAEAGAQT